MHSIEPYWKWRDIYNATADELSPFYGKTHSEFEFTDKIYNYLIHPQWDSFGSETLYIKQIYTNYKRGVVILEFIGEWNDCLNNDIMFLKRDIIDTMIENNIYKFILIGENILEFFADIEDYYEEWYDDIQQQHGYIAAINFKSHIINEMQDANLHHYIEFIGIDDDEPINWRQFKPIHLIEYIESLQTKMLNP